MEYNCDHLIKDALAVIELEATAISHLANKINADFITACKLILACKAKVIVTGIGKSGHIANKIAATMSSTGTPAFFLHPAEALHGDIGMIGQDDCVIAISNSGETIELLTMLPALQALGVPIITLTGKADSKLANIATVNLDITVTKEACPLGLAPTTSSTVALVMGDALAIAVQQARGFSVEDFARSHPGGKIGKRIAVKVDDLMHSGINIPTINEEALVSEAIVEMSQKCLGMTIVTKADNPSKAVGIFTDGDLRRSIDKRIDVHNTKIKTVMTTQFKFVTSDMLAARALSIMQQYAISALPVIDNNRIVGAFNMHDLLKAGIV